MRPTIPKDVNFNEQKLSKSIIKPATMDGFTKGTLLSVTINVPKHEWCCSNPYTTQNRSITDAVCRVCRGWF